MPQSNVLNPPLSTVFLPALSPPFGMWTPVNLGGALLAWWDAEVPTSFITVGNAVTTWVDLVASYAATQSVADAKPTWSATGFNNRPGVTFDGVDDELTLASQPFGSGAVDREVWLAADQVALVADTGSRAAFSFGGNASTNSMSLRRAVVTGVNRIASIVGSGAGATTVFANGEWNGRGVIRSQVRPTATTTSKIGEVAGTPSAVVPAIGTTRARIGAVPNDTAAAFFQGIMSAIIVTSPLSAAQAIELGAYLSRRI